MFWLHPASLCGDGETEAHGVCLMPKPSPWLPLTPFSCHFCSSDSGREWGSAGRAVGGVEGGTCSPSHPGWGFFSVSSAPGARRRLGRTDQRHSRLAQPLDTAL